MIVLSLLSPALALLVILFLCLKNLKKDVAGSLKSLVFPLGMIFGTFGYSFRFFAETNDLLSYFSQVDSMSPYSFGEVMARNADGLYVQDSLFYFVSRCGNNFILPFLVGFVIYAIVFYVLFDMVGRSRRTFKTGEVLLLALIAVGILAPYTIIGNTRCVLSYVLISFAIYRDMIQNRKNLWTLLLYLVPIGLHSSAIVIIAIRLFTFLIQKFEKTKWLILSLVLLFPAIIDFLYAHVSGIFSGAIGGIISGAINKAYWYLHWTSGGWATQIESSISSNLVKIFGTIFLVMIIVLMFKRTSNRNTNDKTIYSSPMVPFLFLMAVLALGCLHIKTGAFWRFEAVVVLFSPVILVPALEENILSKKYFYIIATFAIVLLGYNTLYQISNLNATDTAINFITTPGVRIIYELIKGTFHLVG